LSEEQKNWFFPHSKTTPDWDYHKDFVGSGNKMDREYLESRLPDKFPPDGYFQKDEMDMLLARDTPLRYPPLFYIRKWALRGE